MRPNNHHELREMRTSLGFRQTQMSGEMGLSLRGYQDLEYAVNPLSEIHKVAARYVWLRNKYPLIFKDLERAFGPDAFWGG